MGKWEDFFFWRWKWEDKLVRQCDKKKMLKVGLNCKQYKGHKNCVWIMRIKSSGKVNSTRKHPIYQNQL